MKENKQTAERPNPKWLQLLQGMLPPEKRKRLLPLFVALVVGLCLMFSGGKTVEQADVGNVAESAPAAVLHGAEGEAARLEQKLEKCLSQIDGAGNVSVALVYKSGSRTEFAVDASTTVYSTEEQDADGSRRVSTETTTSDSVVQAQDGSGPVAVVTSAGEVQGVLIVAEGGADAFVAARLSSAVMALLDIPAHRITVCPAASVD